MKKLMFFAAATAAILSSCSKNEVTSDISEGNAITVGTFMRESKATAETAFVVDDVMSVDAYFTETKDFEDATAAGDAELLIDNKTVTKESAGWTYSPIVFWPSNGSYKVSFFAVSDASTTARTFNDISGTSVSFDYTNPATAATQVDLLAASALNRTNNNGEVKFAFNHILSQIKFTFKTDKDYGSAATITVKSVTVDYATDFAGAAKFTFTADTESKGSWSPLTGLQADETITADQVVTASPRAYSALAPIMIIPQAKELKITVNYTVKQGSSTYEETETSINLTPTGGFLQSTVYTVPVILSLNPIVFGEPTIGTWAE